MCASRWKKKFKAENQNKPHAIRESMLTLPLFLSLFLFTIWSCSIAWCLELQVLIVQFLLNFDPRTYSTGQQKLTEHEVPSKTADSNAASGQMLFFHGEHIDQSEWPADSKARTARWSSALQATAFATAAIGDRSSQTVQSTILQKTVTELFNQSEIDKRFYSSKRRCARLQCDRSRTRSR